MCAGFRVKFACFFGGVEVLFFGSGQEGFRVVSPLPVVSLVKADGCPGKIVILLQVVVDFTCHYFSFLPSFLR